MNSLFVDHTLAFEKVATETQLPDDPNQWPNEITDEVYRQVPYVADFDIDVNMDRVDAERGFGFGHIEVGAKSEAPMTANPSQQAAAGIRKVRIPVIIKEGRLQPLDVLVTEDSRMLPLTEARLRQALFRPQAFDVTSRAPGDPSIINQLFPPYRQNYGFAGGGSSVGTKTAASERSLLEVALSCAHEGDLDAFKESMLDSAVKVSFARNPAAMAAVEKIASAEPLQDKLASIEQMVRPTVTQLQKIGEGYLAKQASHRYWAPSSGVLDRGEAVRRFGGKVVLAADLDGSVTTAEGEGATEEAFEAKAELVSEPGRYRVQAETGETLEGLVVPNLIDLDGTKKPIALFSDGSASAVQADIAGIPMGPTDQIQGVTADQANGYGCFFTLEQGIPEATIPFNIKASYQDPQGGTIQMAESFDGRAVEFQVSPNIQAPMEVDGTMLIPETWQWLPLGAAASTALVGSPDNIGKEAAALQYWSSVEIRSGGPDSFSISGPAIEKLSSDERELLNQDDALFVLGGLGVNLPHAQAKLAESCLGGKPIKVKVGNPIKTAMEVRGEASFRASDYLSGTPTFRHRLWKEAAVIPDPIAVDTVLSLGFINPENVTAFVGYLPVIDEAQRRMCELLIASRLGLMNVPGPALEKAIRSTESVVEGLKNLAFET
jgi:hypothetical protein